MSRVDIYYMDLEAVVRVRSITTYNHGRRRITTDWYSWQAAYAEGDGRVV